MPMRALVADPTAPAGVRMASTAEPSAGPGRALVAVRHTSLNYGLMYAARTGRAKRGSVLGWDAAGVVVEAATDRTGPAAGTRVVVYAARTWAQLAAVDVTALAEVPSGVDLADAAALPVAGLAALQALRTAGPIEGRRVLVTGAAGGVGRYAVQLASLAGAVVIASVGSAARAEGLAELGARQVVVGLGDVDAPVDVVLDNVGGPLLVASWGLLAPGGGLQSIGWASGEPAVFPPFATVGPSKSLRSFAVSGKVGADLAELLDLVERGHLSPEIGWRGSWERVDDAATVLLGRRLAGKAVMDVDAAG